MRNTPQPKYSKGGTQIHDGKLLFSLPTPEPSIPSIPFDCLQLMRLVHEVEMKLAGQESIWCLAVKGAIRGNKPARQIINTIKDMATDNYNAVADVLGKSLTDKILKA